MLSKYIQQIISIQLMKCLKVQYLFYLWLFAIHQLLQP